MSDSFEQFLAKTNRMFDRVDRQLLEISIRFAVNAAWELIATTPGPNLQYPDDTEYIATGRLRAGWHFSRGAGGPATRWDGGPYTEHGVDTLHEIEAAIRAAGRLTEFYITNDVAYGYIVHEGLGRHSMPRPWVTRASKGDMAQGYADQARREVMNGQ